MYMYRWSSPACKTWLGSSRCRMSEGPTIWPLDTCSRKLYICKQIYVLYCFAMYVCYTCVCVWYTPASVSIDVSIDRLNASTHHCFRGLRTVAPLPGDQATPVWNVATVGRQPRMVLTGRGSAWKNWASWAVQRQNPLTLNKDSTWGT